MCARVPDLLHHAGLNCPSVVKAAAPPAGNGRRSFLATHQAEMDWVVWVALSASSSSLLG